MDKLVLGFTNAQTAFLTAATQGTAFAFYAVNTIVSNNIKFDGEVNFIEGKLFYRNLFKPTYYLQIKQEVHPKNIKLTRKLLV